MVAVLRGAGVVTCQHSWVSCCTEPLECGCDSCLKQLAACSVALQAQFTAARSCGMDSIHSSEPALCCQLASCTVRMANGKQNRHRDRVSPWGSACACVAAASASKGFVAARGCSPRCGVDAALGESCFPGWPAFLGLFLRTVNQGETG